MKALPGHLYRCVGADGLMVVPERREICVLNVVSPGAAPAQEIDLVHDDS